MSPNRIGLPRLDTAGFGADGLQTPNVLNPIVIRAFGKISGKILLAHETGQLSLDSTDAAELCPDKIVSDSSQSISQDEQLCGI